MNIEANKLLYKVQQQLKAPKGQKNKFGNYNYRSCEDILEAVKKVLPEDCCVILGDDIIEVAGRIYVKATATLATPDGDISTYAWAREAEMKKGMDEAQITGAASSYARKYALNGLFAIDDTKDSDATNTHDDTIPLPEVKIDKEESKKITDEVIGYINEALKDDSVVDIAIDEINKARALCKGEKKKISNYDASKLKKKVQELEKKIGEEI